MTKSTAASHTLAVLVLAALSGCASGATTPAIATGSNAPSIAFESQGPPAPSAHQDLVYVSDQLQKAVLAFPASERANNPPPTLTIPLGAIPEGVWVDRNGILYVGIFGQTPSEGGKVEEFKPGATQPFRTITKGISEPSSLIVDAQGTLYVDEVADLTVEIQVYRSGQSYPNSTLLIAGKSEPVAGGLALDADDDLYVHTLFLDDPPSHVFEFYHGSSVPHDLNLQGLGDLTGLTSDASNNLYVSNSAFGISVYAPGATKPTRKIATPAGDSFAGFVSTRSGKLYVAQENVEPANSSLLEYGIGGSKPANVLTGHLQAPLSAALRAAAF